MAHELADEKIGNLVKVVIRYALTAALVLSIILSASTCAQKARQKMNAPSHHMTNGFRNPHNDTRSGFGDFLRWQFGRGPVEKPTIPKIDIPIYRPEIVQADLKAIAHPDSNKIQVSWIGHSTFLIQVTGRNILTDPIFSKRCSPVSFAGPKRLAPPGIRPDDLPEIHAVMISHNHYDHLDVASIKRIGNGPKFFVPLGLAEWFNNNGITNVTELDWWQSSNFTNLRFHCVPAQHFSGRSLLNRNQSLWAGWVIEADGKHIYFAGDTGYSPDFKKIGERFNPINLALIPIGAYNPRWFMKAVHVDPPEAVEIHQDVRAQQSIAMHWGTFKLADEAMAEPPVYLKQALKQAGLDEQEFITMKFGESAAF